MTHPSTPEQKTQQQPQSKKCIMQTENINTHTHCLSAASLSACTTCCSRVAHLLSFLHDCMHDTNDTTIIWWGETTRDTSLSASPPSFFAMLESPDISQPASQLWDGAVGLECNWLAFHLFASRQNRETSTGVTLSLTNTPVCI